MGPLALPHLAISLKQPWAWAVLTPGVDKDIENRSWWTAFRGAVWLASSAQVTARYYAEASDVIEELTGIRPPPKAELVHGAILGRVEFADCILPGGYQACPARMPSPHATHPRALQVRHPLHPARWHMPECFGYVLEDRKALVTPLPCKGLQRFWRVPDDVLEQLREAA